MTRNRVLIVDDEQSLRELIAHVARAGGHVAVPVASVPDALAELDRGPFDLVVTDLQLPGLGGLELLAALSARRAAPPAVVVTGSDDERLLDAARMLGARDVIRKPFGFAELRRAIDGAVAPMHALAA